MVRPHHVCPDGIISRAIIAPCKIIIVILCSKPFYHSKCNCCCQANSFRQGAVSSEVSSACEMTVPPTSALYLVYLSRTGIIYAINRAINMTASVLTLLGGSIMIRILLAVLTIVMVYALAKLMMHYWSMYRTFRGLPHHPNTHWLWGHAHLVCSIFNRVALHRLYRAIYSYIAQS